MRKLSLAGLVLGLLLLMPAAARAQLSMIQPQDFTGGYFSHDGYDLGGWFAGADFLYLTKLFGAYNGSAPDSILSVGYRFEDGTVMELSWWDQWFSTNPNPTDTFQIIDFMTRFKTYDNGCFRQWGTWGPRAILAGQSFPIPGGAYTVDNRMLGLYVGCMNEWYLGTNPLGAWSFVLDGDVGAYANFVKQAAGGAALNSFTLSGSLEGKAGFIWYVSEGITIHFGLEALTIINMQEFTQAPPPGGGVPLRPMMPVYLGIYLGFGFVF